MYITRNISGIASGTENDAASYAALSGLAEITSSETRGGVAIAPIPWARLPRLDKTHEYEAILQRDATRNSLFDRLVETALQGSGMDMVLHAIGRSTTSPEEIRALKAWLDKWRANSHEHTRHPSIRNHRAYDSTFVVADHLAMDRSRRGAQALAESINHLDLVNITLIVIPPIGNFLSSFVRERRGC